MKFASTLYINKLPSLAIGGMIMANYTLCDSNFQKLLKSGEKFDAVIVEMSLTDALLSVGYYFDAPTIGLSTSFASKRTVDLVAAPVIPSYIPHIFTDYMDRMTFWERLTNWFLCTIDDIFYPLKHRSMQEKLLPHFSNKKMPTLSELMRNVSLVLLNTHVTFGYPRPYPPNMIEVGGIHINKSDEKLPENVKEFLNKASNGAIYLSLGSALKFSKLESNKLTAIANAFKSFPNMRLLIKSDVNLSIPSHHSDDVIIQNWFPQEAILAHSNVKLFITHGGLLSTMESIYFGKPMVGVPLTSDQYLNVKASKIKGCAEGISVDKLNGDLLKDMVEKVLLNQRY